MVEENNLHHQNYQYHLDITENKSNNTVQYTVQHTLQGVIRGLILHPVNGSSCGAFKFNSTKPSGDAIRK